MEQITTLIKPGLSLDIVAPGRHMRSIIYEVINRRIIIAQTHPPLTTEDLDREVSLTFLVRTDEQPLRYGIQAIVTEFIASYQLVSSEVEAVVLEQQTRVDAYNLRLEFRVRPPANSKLNIEWKGRRLNIIDISVGGFQFSYKGNDFPQMHEEFRIALIIDNAFLELTAKVLRIMSPVFMGPDLHYIGAQFIGNSRNYERHLTRKILEIQRKLLIEGKLV